MSKSEATTILCPYCQRQFATEADLRNHMRVKRKVSASHGLLPDGQPRPRSEIEEGINDAAT